MIVLALVTALAALALLGLSDPGHYRRRIGGVAPAGRIRRMRAAGWALVVAVLPLSIIAEGPVFGPVAAIGLLMLAAGAVWLALNLLPDLKRNTP